MRIQLESAWTNARALGNRRGIRWFFSGFLFLFSIVFLGGMLWYYWPTLVAYHWELILWPLPVAGLAYFLHLLLSAWGWIILLEQRGVRLSFREHFKIYCMTRLAGRIPGAPWQLVSRAVVYRALGVSNGVIAVASGLEMLFVVISGLLLGALVWFVLPTSTQMRLIWLGPVLVVGLVLIQPASIRWILKRLGQAETGGPLRYRDILQSLAVFALGWAAGGGVLYFVIIAVYPLHWMLLPGVVGAWALSGAAALLVFFSPTGFGIKEVTLGLLLALFMPAGLAIIVAILMRLFLTLAESVAAVLTSRL